MSFVQKWKRNNLYLWRDENLKCFLTVNYTALVLYMFFLMHICHAAYNESRLWGCSAAVPKQRRGRYEDVIHVFTSYCTIKKQMLTCNSH